MVLAVAGDDMRVRLYTRGPDEQFVLRLTLPVRLFLAVLLVRLGSVRTFFSSFFRNHSQPVMTLVGSRGLGAESGHAPV